MDYFISYAAYVDTRVDFLNTVASDIDREIKSFEDIQEIEKSILGKINEEPKYYGIQILNFIKL